MANAHWGGFRTVVPENEVQQIVDAEMETFPRLTEAWDALIWLLARSATTMGRAYSVHDQDLRLYVQDDDALANVPSIAIVYRVAEEINILAVRIEAPVADDED
jgi:hypothetical protein